MMTRSREHPIGNVVNHMASDTPGRHECNIINIYATSKIYADLKVLNMI